MPAVSFSGESMHVAVNTTTVRLVEGDITEQAVDAIVNAANSSLLGGGGVDGAIHRRGGPSILAECREIRRTRYPSGMPPGDATVTGGGALRARWIIHTVGPIWKGGTAGEPAVLERAYRNSLECAIEKNARTIAFPSISTGAYGYPVEGASSVAICTVLDVLRKHPHAFDEITFVLFSNHDYTIYVDMLNRVLRSRDDLLHG